MFDPEVIQVPEGDFIYYGSYFGGISVRRLSADLLHSDPTTQTNVAISNKYEGAEVVRHGGWYYLFASATDCCRGPLTGYAVLVGRSQLPTGPFLDRSGVDLNDDETPADPTDGRAGGSPVIVGNDDPWVGTGHNTVFQDLAGQWWTIYHAVDRNDPYFEGAVGFTKRPVLLDAIDWVDGWPTINGGRGISTRPTAAPAAQPGETTTHHPAAGRRDRAGTPISSLSDTFAGNELASRWSWVRQPDPSSWSVSGGQLRIDTQAADLFEDSNNASVLVERAPQGNFVVETRVRIDVPAEGCCFNYVQAGLVLYENDNSFVKLAVVSIWNTRQTEWAKEVPPGEPGYPRYGNSIVGPPGGFAVSEPTDLRWGVDGPPNGPPHRRWRRGVHRVHPSRERRLGEGHDLAARAGLERSDRARRDGRLGLHRGVRPRARVAASPLNQDEADRLVDWARPGHSRRAG